MSKFVQKNFFYEEYLTRRPTFIKKKFFEKIRPIFNTKKDFESTNFEMFEEVAHNFGKSDDDMI